PDRAGGWAQSKPAVAPLPGTALPGNKKTLAGGFSGHISPLFAQIAPFFYCNLFCPHAIYGTCLTGLTILFRLSIFPTTGGVMKKLSVRALVVAGLLVAVSPALAYHKSGRCGYGGGYGYDGGGGYGGGGYGGGDCGVSWAEQTVTAYRYEMR